MEVKSCLPFFYLSVSKTLLLFDKCACRRWSVFICSEVVSPVSCSCLISSCLRLSDLPSCLLSPRGEHPARPSVAHYLLICLLWLGLLQTHAAPRVCIYSGSLKDDWLCWSASLLHMLWWLPSLCPVQPDNVPLLLMGSLLVYGSVYELALLTGTGILEKVKKAGLFKSIF